jgi:hypothetical protein
MPISWEALTAVASLISSVAVLGAVLGAVRQLRVGAAQVEHLQRATRLEGTMKIFAMLSSPEQQAARRFIALDLAERKICTLAASSGASTRRRSRRYGPSRAGRPRRKS